MRMPRSFYGAARDSVPLLPVHLVALRSVFARKDVQQLTDVGNAAFAVIVDIKQRLRLHVSREDIEKS